MSAAASSVIPRIMGIARVVRELPDTVTFHIDAGSGGFAFAPGQFNMVYALGIGEVPISISGDPSAPSRLVHTVRAVGRVTRPLCALRKGARVGVRGPFGSTWPLAEARGKDVLFVAGGLGLAPLRPAILGALAQRSEFGRVIVLYGARTPDSLLFRRDLEAWRGRLDCDVEVTVDHAATDWHGHVGVVPALISRARFDSRNTVAMLCGPEVMMRFAARELQSHGLPSDTVWMALERSMKCGVGLCGHCQFGPHFVCRDGPVLRLDRIERLLYVREV
jgi:NAD(P)H-flavin reductase